MKDQIASEDLNNLAIAKLQFENAQVKFENFTLKLFLKYQMSDQDSISPDGKIVRTVTEQNKTEEIGYAQ